MALDRSTIIASLKASEEAVLKEIYSVFSESQIEGANARALVAATEKLYRQLHDAFGREYFEKELGELSHEERLSALDSLGRYNWEIRLFYQGTFGQFLSDGNPQRTRLEKACAAHSKAVYELFKASKGQSESRDDLREVKVDKTPLLSAQSSAHSSDRRFAWTGGYSSSNTDLIDFWMWNQGFSAGYSGQSPDVFDAIFFNQYGVGYWEGVGIHAMVNVISQAGHLGLHAIHSALDAAPGAIRTIANVGGDALIGAGHLLRHAADGVSDAAHHIEGCCSGGGDCGQCHHCLSACASVGDCCSACGSGIGECLCKCEAEVIKVVGGFVVACGTMAGEAYNYIANKIHPSPSPHHSSTGGAYPLELPSSTGSAATAVVSSSSGAAAFTSTGVAEAVGGASVEISGPILTPVKIGCASVYAVVLGPNVVISGAKNVNDIYQGCKEGDTLQTKDGSIKLLSQITGAGGFGAAGYLIPWGGPHAGIALGIFGAWAIHKGAEKFVSSRNLGIFGHKRPYDEVPKRAALQEVKAQLIPDAKTRSEEEPTSPLQIIQALDKLDAVIQRETQKARREANCASRAAFRLWGRDIKTEKLRTLELAKASLVKGDLGGSRAYSRLADFDLDEALKVRTSAPSRGSINY